MLFSAINNPLAFLMYAIAILAAITVHEASHATVADHFGDPTARLSGRVSLNPLAHLDPIGTLTLFLLGFGWGKPVPVNSRNFAHPVLDGIQVALAGPFANLALAVLTGSIARFIPLPDIFQTFTIILVQLNLSLMVFNLLPIPPLDGSRILRLFIPETTYLYFEQYGMFLLLFLFFLGGSFLGQLFNTTVIPLSRIILGN